LRQKQTEEAHRIAEARLAGMISIAGDAIISIHHTRRITLFNWGAERIFGYTADEVLGQPIDILLPEELRSRHAAHIVNFGRSPVTTKRMGERSRIAGLRKNGEIFPAEASISRFATAGEWTFTVILRDVSERVQTEETLRHLANQMRDAVAARDQIMAVVSHDLSNPLNAVAMCLSGLHDDPPAPMAKGLVAAAQDSVDLMSRLIQDLRDVASIDAGRLSVEGVVQPLGPVLRRAIELERPVAEERDIALVLEENSIADTTLVDVDSERILQVLSNIIGNACKFTPAHGTIRVSVTDATDAICITVHDTGCGISADALPHVFDRFWHMRGHAKPRSTGLGLTIARGIVEAHGGRMWAESTVGEGSTFFFTVPVHIATA
jgi:PAS domain S-box-containing protein